MIINFSPLEGWQKYIRIRILVLASGRLDLNYHEYDVLDDKKKRKKEGWQLILGHYTKFGHLDHFTC